MTKKKRLIALLLAVATMLSMITTACAAEEVTPELTDRQAVVETLATAYGAGEYAGEWVSFDMAAYARLKNGEVKFSAEYEADAYTAISDADATVTDLAKAEVILNSLGLNSAEVKSEGNEPINNREKLGAISEYVTYSDAIWMLFAGEQKTVELTQAQVTAAIDKLAQNMNDDGLLFGSYAGQVYTDIDSTGWALAAIAPFTRDEADSFGVKEKTIAMSEKMISALSTNQTESGSYGNTYTDASVICGLCGFGIDPTLDERFIKNEVSLADAIMTYLNADKNGFTSGYSSDTDSWATEQAFRALVALEMFLKGEGAPFNIYSFAAKEEEAPETPPTEEPGDTQEPSVPIVPDNPTVPEEKTITVTFQMDTHEGVWLDAQTVEVKENTSVSKLIRKVFDEEGIESKGLSTGYLRSVTYQGQTWAEFGAGAGSGWIYYVNGASPNVGISSYKLSDGDFVLLTYIADYADTIVSGGSSSDKNEEEKEEVKEEEPKVEVSFTDLEGYGWAEDKIKTLAEKGIIKGTGEGSFSPANNITRADFIILLVRAFNQTSDNTENFSDVSESDYFAKELAIAKNNGLVNGVGDNKIDPRGSIKRCDMMVMVYRTLKKLGFELKSGQVNLPDMSSVPEYAKEAVTALVSNGIVNGKGGYIAPNDYTTRAEVAVLISRLLEYK